MAAGSAAANAGAAVLTVTTTQDTPTSGDHQCSLREAIAAVNTVGSPSDCGVSDSISNTIVLPAQSQPYALTIAPNFTTGQDDDNRTGDVDVTSTVPLTISGAGVNQTVISGTTLGDRILNVQPGATVTIKDLTITGGHAPNGANGHDARSTPVAVTATAGVPGSNGGGILNQGALKLEDVAVRNNTAGSGGRGGAGLSDIPNGQGGMAGGAGGAGGGIYNASPGSLVLTDVTVSGNVAGDGGLGGAGGVASTDSGGTGGKGGCCGDGGGIDNVGGSLTITGGLGGTGGQGQGGSSGGALASSGATATLSITNSTLSGNVSGAGGNGGAGGPNHAIPIQDFQSGGDAGNGSAGGGLFVSAGACQRARKLRRPDHGRWPQPERRRLDRMPGRVPRRRGRVARSSPRQRRTDRDGRAELDQPGDRSDHRSLPGHRPARPAAAERPQVRHRRV